MSLRITPCNKGFKGTIAWSQRTPITIVIAIRLSTCTNIRAAPTQKIFVKFYTGEFYENLSRKSISG